MAIHRVSVSLSESEYSQLVQAAGLLGIKPTTAAHRSIKHGLIALAKEAQAVSSQIQSLKYMKRVLVDDESPASGQSEGRTNQTKPPKPAEQTKEPAKPTNVQRRNETPPKSRQTAEQAKEPAKPKPSAVDASNGGLMVDEEIKQAAKELQRVNSRIVRMLKKSFGSLYKAAQMGIRACGKDITVPSGVQHMLKDLTVDV